MSVLKTNRSESKTEFVNTANMVYIHTINFLSRLSSRYSRLLVTQTVKLAAEVLEHAEKANNIYPSNDIRRNLRETHLLEARASLMALDIQLSHCYNVMMTNPAGCFSTGSGKQVASSDAKKRLGNMAQNIGELIDRENGLLTKMLKSNKKIAK